MLAVALRPFNNPTHCTCFFPLLLHSNQSRRTILERFFGRDKKKRETLDPENFEYPKDPRTPAPDQQPPKKGDLAPGSVIDDEETGPDLKARKIPRDPKTMAAALDPIPTSRKRWERKMLIRDIHKQSRLSKTQKIKRTEREHLAKSHWFKTSVKKLFPLARQIAGKPIEEAIVQMRFSKKRAAYDVKKHLEYARDEAIVRRGMGLGGVPEAVAETGKTGTEGDGSAGLPKGQIVEDKNGKQRWVTDKTNMYVDQAWVGRGSYTISPSYRAKGRVDLLRHPTTSTCRFTS